MAPKASNHNTDDDDCQILGSSSAPPKRVYKNKTYLPLQNEDLKRILSCSASAEQGEKALRKFQKMRSETDAWRRKAYNPAQDRWLTRLKRYLKFFYNRKTASGWPITPFKFIIWAKHDPRPTIRSFRTYLDTIEVARAVTHALFVPEFPDIINHSTLLNHPDVMKLTKEMEVSLAESQVVPEPSAKTSKKNHSSSAAKPPSIERSKTKKVDWGEPKKKKRKLSSDSDVSSQALWDLPPHANKKQSKPSKKIIDMDNDNHKTTSVKNQAPIHRPPRRPMAASSAASSSKLEDPLLRRIHRFSDLKDPQTRETFLNAFRRHHPNTKSVKEEIEELSEDIEDLTSARGELSRIASREVLTICLESYLEFWAQQKISGFPIQAIKLCIWFDSIQVNRKEAIDIAVGFERLGKRIEDQIDNHKPILFEAPSLLMQSPLWNSFLDHFGWQPIKVEPKEPVDDKPINNNEHIYIYDNDIPEEQGQEPKQEDEEEEEEEDDDMEINGHSSPPPLPEPSTNPSQDYLVPKFRQVSISSVGSSLSSLPHSLSPLLPRHENSLESECMPDQTECIPDQSDLDHSKRDLESSHNKENGNDGMEQTVQEEETEDERNKKTHETNLNQQTSLELKRLSYKKAYVNSSEHRLFLLNLRQFTQLFHS